MRSVAQTAADFGHQRRATARAVLAGVKAFAAQGMNHHVGIHAAIALVAAMARVRTQSKAHVAAVYADGLRHAMVCPGLQRKHGVILFPDADAAADIRGAGARALAAFLDRDHGSIAFGGGAEAATAFSACANGGGSSFPRLPARRRIPAQALPVK